MNIEQHVGSLKKEGLGRAFFEGESVQQEVNAKVTETTTTHARGVLVQREVFVLLEDDMATLHNEVEVDLMVIGPLKAQRREGSLQSVFLVWAQGILKTHIPLSSPQNGTEIRVHVGEGWSAALHTCKGGKLVRGKEKILSQLGACGGEGIIIKENKKDAEIDQLARRRPFEEEGGGRRCKGVTNLMTKISGNGRGINRKGEFSNREAEARIRTSDSRANLVEQNQME
ncbi:hypothetical protein VNO80_19258 [Phaseolus coccineus]|uniref:Uncharacterized protein n=1 Tax=Phaseolus coccineus TaxID=3886 RepID=A0AAN9MFS9_PHACN